MSQFGQVSPDAWRVSGKTMTIDEYIEEQGQQVNSCERLRTWDFYWSPAGQTEGNERQRVSRTA